MAESITLAPVTTFTNDSSAVATVNANYQLIASAFNNVLDRFGTAPNQMQAVLDMNSFNIINLPGPATVNSPVRLVDVINPSVALTVPPVGTSGATVPLLNGTNTWSAPQTFTSSGLAQAIITQQTYVGTSVGGSIELGANTININSDNANYALGLNYLLINASFGGTALSGTRSGITTILTQTAVNTTAVNSTRFYVGSTPVVITNTGDGGTNTGAGALGGYYGANPQVRTTGANCQFIIGNENNIFGTSAATQQYQIGYNSLGIFVNQGALVDAAVGVSMGASGTWGQSVTPGNGWNVGFLIYEAEGFNPLHATNGVVLGGQVINNSNIPCKHVFDLTTFTPTTNLIKYPFFNVTFGGNTTLGNSVTGASPCTLFIQTPASGPGPAVFFQYGATVFAGVGCPGELGFGDSVTSLGVNGFSGVQLYTNGVKGFAVDGASNVIVGTAALGTTATNGFLYIPTCAGPPTGVPTVETGRYPMIYDSTTHKFWMYDVGASAWKGIVLT